VDHFCTATVWLVLDFARSRGLRFSGGIVGRSFLAFPSRLVPLVVMPSMIPHQASNKPLQPTALWRCASMSICLFFSAAIQSLCYADVTKLPTEDRKALQNLSRFHEVHVTSDLPSAILALCDGGSDGKLAELGQKWNATDAISDPTLPGKRLIWGAVGGDYYVVHYERGGIAHTFHILVARLAKDDAKPKAVWRGVGGPFKDYPGFLDALRSGKLDDRLDYPH
jgi:hypothetical protein